ncbi:hypothetical protein Gogos_003398 [Gossypium gossypioides]|uniref:Uncharacterized protein n=1 Tax=Gossypium gossypioides TaxID=34282 RepID=A0A7J9CM35_GOSGO|nr:hypothetical protein [Gossypium gossypioides]MBA0749477.1 hypothetical protein [Gossypium gossypioides]
MSITGMSDYGSRLGLNKREVVNASLGKVCGI